LENQGPLLFLPKNSIYIHFLLKTLRKHPIDLLERPSKNNPKPEIHQTKYFEAQIYFCWCFQGKQTPSHNFPHHKEPFNGQDCLIAEIFSNDHFFSLNWNSTASSLSSHQKRIEKKEKNEVKY
jgi:hypothetical protein